MQSSGYWNVGCCLIHMASHAGPLVFNHWKNILKISSPSSHQHVWRVFIWIINSRADCSISDLLIKVLIFEELCVWTVDWRNETGELEADLRTLVKLCSKKLLRFDTDALWTSDLGSKNISRLCPEAPSGILVMHKLEHKWFGTYRDSNRIQMKEH